MEQPKACLFDLDGLLLDTEPLHGKAWSETARKFGMNLQKEQLMILQGRRREDCAKQILSWIGNSMEIQDFLSIHDPISRRLLSHARPMQGAKSLVEWCYKNKLPMALVSSSTFSSVSTKSAPHEWLKLIHTRVLGDDPDLNEGKPAPDCFLLAAKKLGISPQSCWALEDSHSGALAALSAGCKVWILQNNNSNNNKRNNKKTESISNPRYIKSLDVVLENLKVKFQTT